MQEESNSMTSEHRTYPQLLGTKTHATHVNSIQSVHNEEDWPLGRPDLPQIKVINVKCEKNHMKVNIEFDRPFYGTIFSKGHYSDNKCLHLPSGSGHLSVNFDIFLGTCGMASSDSSTIGNAPSVGLFIENTIIIQYDPQVQEIWDQARKLRCTWYDYYEKSVAFRPFNVDMLDAVTSNFLGDNIQCWMQIQAGKGPWSSEVAGIVKIGQTMTMVLAIKDDEDKFDMLVRNCIAHDGTHQPIQLIDNGGCVVRPKIISKFQKVKNFGHSATVVSYAFFQAFKFPDSMNVHFQCIIQVCRYECPEPVCYDDHSSNYHDHQKEGDAEYEASKVNLQRQVLTAVTSSSTNNLENHKIEYKAPNTAAMVKRAGESLFKEESNENKRNYTLAELGANPRSISKTHRIKRYINTYKNIPTQKVIQVVAPGDVAFSLASDKKMDLFDETVNQYEMDNYICMSQVGFLTTFFLLISLMTIASIIAVFFYVRVRSVTRSLLKNASGMIGYESPSVFSSMTTMHFNN